MPAAERLNIRRLDARYLVAADHPAPEAVRQRLDAALAGVGRDLGSALAPLATGELDGVWLVRRVELDLSLDADLPAERLGRDWARFLAAAIARKLDRAADGVVFFADRTAHLARFMADLATGDAWSLWYHERFAGLKGLPVAMALRTAILADGEEGLRALGRLLPAELGRVLDALGPAESCRVLDDVADTASRETPAALLRHLESAGWPAQSLACPEGLALAILAALAAGGSPVRGKGLVRALAWLRHRAALGADLTGPLALGDGARLRPLLAVPPPLRESLARLAAPEPAAATLAEGVSRFTAFGGPLMLLRFVDELPLEALGRWPPAAGVPAAAVVRALVLAQCAGATRALAFVLDPVWRDLLGLPSALLPTTLAPWCGAVDSAMLRAWRRTLPPTPRPDRATSAFLALPPALCPNRELDRLLARAARRVLDRFAAHLPGFAGSSPAWLVRNFLAVPARSEICPDGLRATLGRPPLDVVLAITGLARTRLELPWLRPPRLELRREG
jgi:hypothetical protein